MNGKKFCGISFGVSLFMLLMIAGITIYVDPVFHYHAPIEGFPYQLRLGERYVNDGIIRHWNYDAIITGSSMTENFKTTELDQLWGTHSIKVPYSGGRFKEIDQNLQKAFLSGNKVTLVIRGLDTQLINVDKNEKREDAVYPEYLTNNNLFDDVNYLFNKEIFCWDTINTILLSHIGYDKVKSFDAYTNWMANAKFGKENILANYKRPTEVKENLDLEEDDIKRIKENLAQNVTETVKRNPDCDFYFFFPPYSVLWYDYLKRNGEFNKNYEIQKLTIETLLEYENVKLFAWDDCFDLTTNLELYRDMTHYNENINSQMLVWMKENKGLLNEENYEVYLEKCYVFYDTYDYDGIFE